MRSSFFVPYAYGTAVTNLKTGERLLEVYPNELLPMVGGELKIETVKVETKGIDANGDVYETSIDLGYGLTCEWLGGNNRITPDNVRRGERIIIYRLGDSDRYFWRSAGMDQNLRRLETIIWCFSANPSNADQDAPSPENSYYFEVSTHSGLITLSTTQLNGEKAAFFLQLNMADGKALFKDEKGNSFFFNSVETFLEILNASETRITVDKELIDVFAKSSISYETETFNVTAGKAVNVKAGEAINVETKATTLKSADSINIETTAFDIKTSTLNVEAAATAVIKSPTITLDGVVLATKNMAVTGPVTAAAIAVAGGAAGMDKSGALTVAQANVTGATTMGGPLQVASIASAGVITMGGKVVLTA